MKNKTKSKIIISMNHIDHANKIFEFLKKAYDECCNGQGGDVIFSCNSEETIIGHDVIIKKLQHIIYKE